VRIISKKEATNVTSFNNRIDALIRISSGQ